MKAKLPVIFLIGFAATAFGQEMPRAYLPAKIPDGSAPPPVRPKATWIIPPADVLREKSYEEGGRTILVREIKPIALPPPPEPEPSAPVEITAEFRERMAAYRLKHPRQKMIALGATVYRLEDGSTRTLLRTSGEGQEEPVQFWSSGDFSLLAGIGAFTDSKGETRALLMTWSIQDHAALAARMARLGRTYRAPTIPELPTGKPAYSIQKGSPDANLLSALDALHQILEHDGAELQRAYDARVMAAKQREEYMKANPPQAQDITVNYWRIETPAKGEKGEQP